ncbi:hypothetical protein ACTA71_003870 [Dictyostelium dimigraforme]
MSLSVLSSNQKINSNCKTIYISAGKFNQIEFFDVINVICLEVKSIILCLNFSIVGDNGCVNIQLFHVITPKMDIALHVALGCRTTNLCETSSIFSFECNKQYLDGYSQNNGHILLVRRTGENC